MILLHTSDWHIGHSLHNHDRAREHEAFLAWLLDQLQHTQADALLIAGDIFDTAHPSAAAQTQWYRFLAQAYRRFPDLDIVVIGGNHDSAARLDAPLPVLDALSVKLVGGARLHGSKRDPAEMVVPLHNRNGDVAAIVAAVPYLRLPDLPRVTPTQGQDPIIEGVRLAYRHVLDVARAQRQPGQALIAMGHCYMSGTELSDKSERRILMGNQHALPTSIFPEDVAYVALGHLHKPQRVGAEHIRYSGSPIPLSMAERHYKHQILRVELDGESVHSIESILVPRTVDILRIPTTGALSLTEALTAIEQLAEATDDRHSWPFLEVHVRLPQPEPTLRKQIDDALTGRRARLVRLSSQLTGTTSPLAEAATATDLSQLTPEQVFILAYKRHYETEPDQEILARFATLEEAALEVSA